MAPLLAKGYSRAESKKRAKELIIEVGLKHRMNTRANKLSGGEKQRTVIARALATDSKILACDEPTGNLDSKTSQQIIELIGKLAHDKLVLIVTHDYESFKDIATRKITMRDGHIIDDEVLKQVETKEKCEVSLNSNNKISLKNSLLLSVKNIITSPKRTIFSSLVLFVQFFIISFLVISILSSNVDYAQSVVANSNYNLHDDKVVYIYPTESQSIEEYKKTYSNSRFYVSTCDFFDQIFYVSKTGGIDYDFNFCVNGNFCIRPYLEGEQLEYIVGDPIENEDDVILSVSSDYVHKNFLKYSIKISIPGKYNDTILISDKFNVKGIVERPGDLNCIYVHENKLKEISENYDKLKAEFYLQESFGFKNINVFSTNLNDNSSTRTRFFLTSSINGDSGIIEGNVGLKENTIYIDSSIKVDDFYLKAFNHKFDLSKYQIDNALSLKKDDDYFFIFPDQIYNDYLEMDSRYVVYNSNKDDAEKMYSEFNKLNIHTERTTDKFSGKTIVYAGSYILTLFLIVDMFLVLIFVISIGRVILRIIYGSKKNNYVIFKTIGFNEKKIKVMDYLEIIIMAIFVYIIEIIAVFFIIKDTGTREMIDAFTNPLFYLITFIIVIFVALDFMRRFENKVFNKSIASTLKAGDYLD